MPTDRAHVAESVVAGRPLSREVLETWFQERISDLDEVQLTSVRRVTGGSHELLDVRLTGISPTGPQHHDFVIRFDPVTFRKRRTSNIAREFTVQALLSALGAKVPTVHWLEPDDHLFGAAFYVMDKLVGRVPRDKPPFKAEGWVVDLGAAGQRDLWERTAGELAVLHSIPTNEFTALRRDPSTVDDFAEHIDAWRANYEWCLADAPESPKIAAAWRWLMNNLPTNRPTGITWGDARLANIMFGERGTDIVAFLDWEDVSLGGPLFDLGRLALMDEIEDVWGYPKLPGFGRFDEFLAIWANAAKTSADDIGWYCVFTVCYCAGLVARMNSRRAVAANSPAAPSVLTIESQERVLDVFMNRYC